MPRVAKASSAGKKHYRKSPPKYGPQSGPAQFLPKALTTESAEQREVLKDMTKAQRVATGWSDFSTSGLGSTLKEGVSSIPLVGGALSFLWDVGDAASKRAFIPDQIESAGIRDIFLKSKVFKAANFTGQNEGFGGQGNGNVGGEEERGWLQPKGSESYGGGTNINLANYRRQVNMPYNLENAGPMGMQTTSGQRTLRPNQEGFSPVFYNSPPGDFIPSGGQNLRYNPADWGAPAPAYEGLYGQTAQYGQRDIHGGQFAMARGTPNTTLNFQGVQRSANYIPLSYGYAAQAPRPNFGPALRQAQADYESYYGSEGGPIIEEIEEEEY